MRRKAPRQTTSRPTGAGKLALFPLQAIRKGITTMNQSHLVLLGDSIFDNAVYVPGGPAVIDHMNHMLPRGWKSTLLARDGDMVADMTGQFSKTPPDATHLVISIGGNDALETTGVLGMPVTSMGDALRRLTEIRRSFQRRYRAMLQKALALELPLAVCTIYDSVPGLSGELQTALCLFNDTITQEAMAARTSVIDLRRFCTESADYSAVSPIEPSAQGGHKIAGAIAEWAFPSGLGG